MVNQNILQKVFHLKYEDNTGTCFLVSIKGKDYLITARHIFNNCDQKKEIEFNLLHNSDWVQMTGKLLLHENTAIDIAVLDIHKTDVKHLGFELGSRSYFLSQDCYFLGFPFELSMDDFAALQNNRGFPLAFVKKGIISAFTDDELGGTIFYLDGHNNFGFSGGPVVIRDYESSEPSDLRVIAVISSYVIDEKEIETPFGRFSTKENSGIVVASGFDHVFEILKSDE